MTANYTIIKVKLGDLVKLKYGKDHKHLKDGTVPVYGSGGIMRMASGFLYAKPSVLIPRKGTLSNLFYVEEPFWAGDTMFYTEIDTTKVIPAYLYYQLLTKDLASKNVGSAVPSLNTAVLNSIEIELPPLSVQKQVIDLIQPLTLKIETNKIINQKLEETGKAIFKHVFFDFSDYSEDDLEKSEMGLKPKSWDIKSLDGIATYTNGLAMQKNRPKKGEQGLKVMKIRELRLGLTDNQSEECTPTIKPDFIVENGDVIFAWSASLLVDFWNGGTVGLNQHLFKVTSEKYPKWFYYAWTKYHLDRFIKIAQDKATTMGHIKRQDLSAAKVFIPDVETMKNLEDQLHPIFERINNNVLEIRKLELLRDSLLPQVLTGKLLPDLPLEKE